MKKKFFIVAAVLFSSQLQAQQDSTKNLDEVVVTANKYPQKQSSTGKVLTVINREQLEKNTGRTLAQVLNEQAGIVVNGSQNALGTNQLVYLRGAGSAATLILVDGIPANDASGLTSEFDLNHFTVDQVERVEMLKGSQSVLYGSDAMAGVINIITKKNNGKKPLAFNATAASGTCNTLKLNTGIGGQFKAINYNLQYSRLQSDGFSAAQDITGTGEFDNDGFNQNALSLNVGINAAKNWKLRLFGQAEQYKADIDDASFTDDRNNTINNKNLQVGIASVYQFTRGTFHVNLNLNNINRQLKDKRNIPEDPNDYDPYNGLYKGKSLFAEAYANLNLHQHVGLLIGTDMRKQTASIATTYGNLSDDSLKATQLSGYASLLVKSLSGFNAEIGSRFTHHSEFGSAVTYSVNPSYIIHKQLKIFANVATGFRSPSLYNLASEYGNKTLKPERSNSYEAGMQFFDKNNKVNIRGTYFNRTVKDVIIFKSLFVAPYGQYDNADKQKDHGFELEATLHPSEKWNITASYSFVDGNIETISKATGKDTSYYNLYRRPKNTINAGIGYQATKALYTSIGFRWVDKRQDPYFNPNTFETEVKELKAYYNADVYISYQAAKQVKLFADLRNITDRTYFDLYGYNSRRFNMMAGVMVNF
ncbi:MAG: TonB-dependent receptor [Chitinophagaceae bacterium]|nr:TonB-dependent receptor [Chitinophagaceae bacterium]